MKASKIKNLFVICNIFKSGYMCRLLFYFIRFIYLCIVEKTELNENIKMYIIFDTLWIAMCYNKQLVRKHKQRSVW